jgi:type I restriction enzyme M protein
MFYLKNSRLKSGRITKKGSDPFDPQKIIETYFKRETVEKYAYLATLDEIKENDFNLNIPRYVDTFEEEDEIDLVAVRTERLTLQSQLLELETQMEGYLHELGYEVVA